MVLVHLYSLCHGWFWLYKLIFQKMYLESLVSGHPDFQDPDPRQNYPKPDTVRLIKQKYYFFRHWICSGLYNTFFLQSSDTYLPG